MATLENPPSFWSDLLAKGTGGLFGELRAPYRRAQLTLDSQRLDRADAIKQQEGATQRAYDRNRELLRQQLLRTGVSPDDLDEIEGNIATATQRSEAAAATHSRLLNEGRMPTAKATGEATGAAALNQATADRETAGLGARKATAENMATTAGDLATRANLGNRAATSTAQAGANTAKVAENVSNAQATLMTPAEALDQAKRTQAEAADAARRKADEGLAADEERRRMRQQQMFEDQFGIPQLRARAAADALANRPVNAIGERTYDPATEQFTTKMFPTLSQETTPEGKSPVLVNRMTGQVFKLDGQPVAPLGAGTNNLGGTIITRENRKLYR